ncbi:MAG: glycosyltransferase family 2 protein [Candidatus Omnitrophica bacterium]|nr:glycosyltransferase family 2 protein [Candidatus Omnitrophota bacterium]
MKISGFTIVRNAIKYNYPVVESITSILPVCDEFIVNAGDSEDGTLDLLRSIKNPKLRIIETIWDMSKGPSVLSEQTNIALGYCTGDWAFYLQTDEVIHEADLPRLKGCMQKFLNDPGVDALRFKWLHFYGSFWRYRIDAGWYQKQDRIIRNNGDIESFGDAFGFRRKDGRPLRSCQTGCLLYHYGWVNSTEDLARRSENAARIGYGDRNKSSTGYGDLHRFPVYFGTHPSVISARLGAHALSRKDRREIDQRFWWHPLRLLRLRYKTGRRVKQKME